MAKRGRKTKLTPEIERKLTSAIAAGNYHEVACSLAGISTSTFYSWMKKGEQAKSGQFLDFREAIKKAEAIAEAKRIQMITEASETNWQAAAWYLERRYPDRWGKQNKHDVNMNGEMTFKVTLPPEFMEDE
jgi:hypothetical protein